MNRFTVSLLHVGLFLSAIGAVGQLIVMLLDVFLLPQLRWYWGGSLAYFAAPVAFALTLRLLDGRSTRDVNNAQA